jgi:hypothetical protein
VIGALLSLERDNYVVLEKASKEIIVLTEEGENNR